MSQNPNRKLQGYDFYRETLGSPKSIVAPMVDQSELPWRILSRRYGAELVYTPMINAKLFAIESNTKYRLENFNTVEGEEGGPLDRPLIVQFCANDPEALLASAKIVAPYCDAVDINLGCPQDIAKKGRYGSFLQDDWDLIYKLINILHVNLDIPVTVKCRLFPDVNKTVEYAKMIERAGAQILTVHGRVREQRGHNTGLADWDQIRAIREAISIPMFANGNILYHADVPRCLASTGTDGVMSAEGQLYNAALFSSQNPPHADLALEYLEIVKSLKTRTSYGAIKAHLFKLMRPGLCRETDLRDRLGKMVAKDGIEGYEDIAKEMKIRMDRDAKEAEGTEAATIRVDEKTGLQQIPHWLAQPYFRPLPPPKADAEKKGQSGAKAPKRPLGDAGNDPTEAPSPEKRAKQA